MRKIPENKISEKALTVWKISACIGSLIFLTVVVGLSVGVYFLELPLWMIAIGLTIGAIYAVMTILVIPTIRHRLWRYEVHEHEIDLQYGIFIVKRVLVPMVRVQHVDTHQGPLLRKYNLASVSVSTAATTHEIPALNVEEADVLRDYISRLARVTDDDL